MELLVAMTLLSLLSVGVLFGLRIGLNAMDRYERPSDDEPRACSVWSVCLTQQIAGFIPSVADCFTLPKVRRTSAVFSRRAADHALRFVLFA